MALMAELEVGSTDEGKSLAAFTLPCGRKAFSASDRFCAVEKGDGNLKEFKCDVCHMYPGYDLTRIRRKSLVRLGIGVTNEVHVGCGESLA
jgi:hypothetical protein